MLGWFLEIMSWQLKLRLKAMSRVMLDMSSSYVKEVVGEGYASTMIAWKVGEKMSRRIELIMKT